jgi:ethanolamine transporter EutH
MLPAALPQLVINGLLPLIAYLVLRSLGISVVLSLVLSGAFPACGVLVKFPPTVILVVGQILPLALLATLFPWMMRTFQKTWHPDAPMPETPRNDERPPT